jgi:hypothetical protein
MEMRSLATAWVFIILCFASPLGIQAVLAQDFPTKPVTQPSPL